MSELKPPYLEQANPEIYKAFGQASASVAAAVEASGLDKKIIELIFVRASQINGCPTCLSVHVPKALEVGVTQRQIDVLPSWRRAYDVYSETERAALEIAEYITLVSEREHFAPVYQQAAQHFTKEQLTALEWAVVTINAFNRVSIVSEHPTKKY